MRSRGSVGCLVERDWMTLLVGQYAGARSVVGIGRGWEYYECRMEFPTLFTVDPVQYIST